MKRTILACAVTALAVGATSATAAQVLTSKDIKDESIQNRDLRDGAFTWSKLAPATQRKIQRFAGATQTSAASQSAPPAGTTGAAGANGAAGAAGPRGPQGETGAQGRQGEQGEPGQALVANATTSSAGPNGLLAVPVEGSSTFTGDKGTALVSVPVPAGRYLVTGTALFFAVGASSGQYGEARLFTPDGSDADTLPDPQGGSIFSGEIPPAALGGVGGQTTASVEVDVDAATTLTLRGRVRDTVAGASNVLGGANLIVTRINE